MPVHQARCIQLRPCVQVRARNACNGLPSCRWPAALAYDLVESRAGDLAHRRSDLAPPSDVRHECRNADKVPSSKNTTIAPPLCCPLN